MSGIEIVGMHLIGVSKYALPFALSSHLIFLRRSRIQNKENKKDCESQTQRIRRA